jgi:hypothetical protein
MAESISSRRTNGPLLELADRLDAHPAPEAREFCEHAHTVLTEL